MTNARCTKTLETLFQTSAFVAGERVDVDLCMGVHMGQGEKIRKGQGEKIRKRTSKRMPVTSELPTLLCKQINEN